MRRPSEPPSIAPLLLALVALGGLGCDGAAPLEWRIAFANDADRSAARRVIASIRRDACDGDVLHEVEIPSGAAVEMDPPDLEAGSYAFVADALDASCRRIASACALHELPRAESVLTTVLETADDAPTCADGVCVDGACTPCGAGGCSPDAGSRDAGPPDAGPTDAGVPPSLAAPRVLFPWNGVTTGSALAPDEATLVAHPRRPRFVWEPVDGAASYVVELVPCDALDPSLCDFASPTLRLVTIDTNVRPEAALAVERTTPPLGARFAFRVGACAELSGAGCTFSDERYLDVGRVAEDVDGDGTGDVFAVAVPSGADPELRRYATFTTTHVGALVATIAGLVSVHWIGDYDADGAGELVVVDGVGSSRRVRYLDDLVDTGSTLADARAVTAAGDVDGDGYRDFAFVDGGEVRVQLGGPTWSGTRSIAIRAPTDVSEHALALAPAGDRDGDGNADLAVASRIAADMVRIDVYSLADRTPVRVGDQPSFATGEVGLPMGNPVTMAGGLDMDGDGRPEIAVGRHFANALTVFFGDGARETTSGSLSWMFMSALAMGRLDGTDRARVVAGAPEHRDGSDRPTGITYHVAYTGDPFSLTGITYFNDSQYGSQVAAVDVDGDGREDILSLAGTGEAFHVGLFDAGGVGGSAIFLFPPVGASLSAISR